jgi:hypothetical protein
MEIRKRDSELESPRMRRADLTINEAQSRMTTKSDRSHSDVT